MRLHTRTLAVVFVALLVALAGCTGGPGDSGDATDGADDEPETDSDETTEADGADDSDGSDSEMDAGGATGGTGSMAFTTDKRRIVESHAQTLTAAGSYTAVINTSFSGSGFGDYGEQVGDSAVSTMTVYADPSTGAYYQTMGSSSASSSFDYRFESYSPAGENVTYTLIDTSGQPFYMKQPRTVDTSQHVSPGSWSFYDSLDFESQGTVTRDGETLERYVVTDVQQVNDTGYFTGSLASIDVEVLYNPSRNLMQEMSWTYTYEQDSGEDVSSKFRISYEDIGSTTVPEPGWLGEAKQQAIDTGSYTDGDYSGGDYSSGDFDFNSSDFASP